MSKIDELIKQLCPDGVQFKKLGEVSKYVRGLTYSKKDETKSADGIKVLRANNISFKTNTLNFSDVKIVSNTVKVKEPQWLRKNDILICAGSGSKEHIGKVAFIFEDIDYAFGGFMAVLRTNETLSSRFLFHLLVGQNFSKYLESALNTTTINNLNSQIMNGFLIPIPPLEIQKEIAKTLDLFTELEDELEDELGARETQYAFYRDALFRSEGKNIEWKTLGEIGEFTRGKRFVKTDIVSEGVPCIHYGEMYTHYKIWAKESKSFLKPELAAKLRVAKTGDVIIVAAGETIEDIGLGVAWLGESDIVIHDACFAYSHEMHPNYVSHFLQTDLFHSQIKRHISSGKISAINALGLSKAKIPVPALEEQQRVASILDKFHLLLNDISIGIPAEIVGRRKQYEYYRNRLLTFNRVSNG